MCTPWKNHGTRGWHGPNRMTSVRIPNRWRHLRHPGSALGMRYDHRDPSPCPSTHRETLRCFSSSTDRRFSTTSSSKLGSSCCRVSIETSEAGPCSSKQTSCPAVQNHQMQSKQCSSRAMGLDMDTAMSTTR